MHVLFLLWMHFSGGFTAGHASKAVGTALWLQFRHQDSKHAKHRLKLQQHLDENASLWFVASDQVGDTISRGKWLDTLQQSQMVAMKSACQVTCCMLMLCFAQFSLYQKQDVKMCVPGTLISALSFQLTSFSSLLRPLRQFFIELYRKG